MRTANVVETSRDDALGLRTFRVEGEDHVSNAMRIVCEYLGIPVDAVDTTGTAVKGIHAERVRAGRWLVFVSYRRGESL